MANPYNKLSHTIELFSYILNVKKSLIKIYIPESNHKKNEAISTKLANALEQICEKNLVFTATGVEEIFKLHNIGATSNAIKFVGVPFKTDHSNNLTILLYLFSDQPISISKAQITAIENLRGQAQELNTLNQNRGAIKSSLKEELSLEDYEHIIRGINAGIWIWNVKTGECKFNERWANIIGYTLSELEPISIDTWYQFVYPPDGEKSAKALNKVFEKKKEFYNIDCRMFHKEGHLVWVNYLGKVIEWTDDGEPLIMAGSHIDITNRKNKEIQYETILDNLPGVVFRYKIDKLGNDSLSLISKGSLETWGVDNMSAQEGIERVWAGVHKEDFPDMRASIQKSAEELSFWRHQWRYHHPTEGLKWQRGAGSPTPLADGSIIWDVITLDITEEKAYELEQQKLIQEIKAKNELINQILENIPLGIAVNEISTGKAVMINNQFSHIYGWDVNDFPDVQTFFEKLYSIKENQENLSGRTLEDILSGDPTRMNWRNKKIKTKSGEQRYINAKNIPIPNEDLMISTVTDITELRKSEQMLQQSNVFLEEAQRVAKIGNWSYNRFTEKITWSKGLYNVYGLDYSKDLNDQYSNWLEIVVPKDRKRVKEVMERCRKDGEPYHIEYQINRPDNGLRYIEEQSYSVKDYDGKVFRLYGTAQDITERKQEEQQLKLLEKVVTKTNDAIVITRANQLDEPGPEIIYVNDALLEMTEYSLDEVIGNNPRMFQGPKTDESELKRLSKALRALEKCEITVVNYKKSGQEFWVHISVFPVFDKYGDCVNYAAVQRDVTEQKNNLLQEQLYREISKIFKTEDNYHMCLEQSLEQLINYLGFSCGEIWIAETNKEKHKLLKSLCRDKESTNFEAKNTVKTFNLSDGLPGKVYDNKRVYIINGLSSNKKTEFFRQNLAKSCGLQTAIGIPIFASEELEFTFVLLSKYDHKNTMLGQDFLNEFSEQLSLEVSRKKLESELNNIFNFTRDILVTGNTDGYFTKLNPSAENILGYSREELKSRPLVEFVHPEDREKTLIAQNTIENGNILNSFENRYIKKNGEIVWLSWTTTEAGPDNLIYASAKDVTQIKKLTELLEEASKIAKIGGWEIDHITNSTTWSEMTKSIFETPEDFKADKTQVKRFFSNEKGITAVRAFLGEEQIKIEFDSEVLITTDKGKDKWIRIIGKPEILNGNLIKTSGSVQDIDKLKSAELDYKKASKEKADVLESIKDGFIAVSKEWIITYWNQSAEKMTSIDKDKALGTSLWDLFPLTDDSIFHKNYIKAMKSREPVHFDGYSDEEESWYEVSAYPTENGISIYFKDITEKKVQQNLIKQANERYQYVVEATKDVIWEWDLQTDEMLWNDNIYVLFGYNRDDALPTCETYLSYLHKDDRDKVNESLSNFIISGQEQWKEEYRFKKSDGSYAYVIDRGILLRDNDGLAEKMIGSITDISYRKKYEDSLRELNEQLQDYTKELERSNEELEQFAYVASHDLQEPLRMVSSFMTQLERKYKDDLDEKAQTYINYAVNGAKRMKDIILDLLEFSQLGKKDYSFDDIDMNQLLEEIIEYNHYEIKNKNAKVNFNDLPTIHSNKSIIFQIFQNLINNSIKYVAEGVSPIVDISVENQAEYWEFHISDNGIGIAEEYQDKVFIIFQRLHTKSEYAGSGMGLAIVKKAVGLIDGEIHLKSTLGKGSIFSIKIPKMK